MRWRGSTSSRVTSTPRPSVRSGSSAGLLAAAAQISAGAQPFGTLRARSAVRFRAEATIRIGRAGWRQRRSIWALNLTLLSTATLLSWIFGLGPGHSQLSSAAMSRKPRAVPASAADHTEVQPAGHEISFMGRARQGARRLRTHAPGRGGTPSNQTSGSMPLGNNRSNSFLTTA